MEEALKERLRQIPGVDRLLEVYEPLFPHIPRTVLIRAIRESIEEIRRQVVAGGSREWGPFEEQILKEVRLRVNLITRPNLRHVVNGTGVVVHTNLGRSPLPREVMDHVVHVAERYSNLEYDLAAGRRGSRYTAVEDLLLELTGAEAAMVVNNNAGAVFLCLLTLAKDRKVVVSRGELIEIGGSFRIPEVMAASGARLCEVGATNRTHSFDYENAIDEETALLFKAHTSNFALLGFTHSVSLKDLVAIGRKHGVLVMEDLGSGSLLDLSAWGLTKEPTVQESVAAGADVVTFSGDKLLAGPQAGIIVGKQKIVDAVKKNPVNRAVRIDKLTLSALEMTLRLYREPREAIRILPTLHMLTESPADIRKRARSILKALKIPPESETKIRLAPTTSRVGGGAMPLANMPSHALVITSSTLSANNLETVFRNSEPPVLGRIENDCFLLDARTLTGKDVPAIQEGLRKVAGLESEKE